MYKSKAIKELISSPDQRTLRNQKADDIERILPAYIDNLTLIEACDRQKSGNTESWTIQRVKCT